MKWDAAVVVCSYDQYCPLWEPFVHGMNKYWIDCPWKMYFITNFLEAPRGYTTIKTGKEISWGVKVKKALKEVNENIILWMMDDFWNPGKVKTNILVEFYDLMVKHQNIDHIRLMCPSTSDGVVVPEKELSKVYENDGRLWHFRLDAEYRASVSLGFWRKEALLQYIEDDMNPWMFEQKASVISTKTPNLYLCAIDPTIFPLCHNTNHYGIKNEIMTKGRWMSGAYEYAKKENLKIDFSHHPNGRENKDIIL